MKRRELKVAVEMMEAPVAVLHVEGTVDSASCAELEKELDQVLDGGHDHVVLDFADLDFMSTAGWSVLVGKLRRVRARKGALHLSGLSSDVEDVYKMLQFDSLLPAHPTLDQAIAAVKAAAAAGS